MEVAELNPFGFDSVEQFDESGSQRETETFKCLKVIAFDPRAAWIDIKGAVHDPLAVASFLERNEMPEPRGALRQTLGAVTSKWQKHAEAIAERDSECAPLLFSGELHYFDVRSKRCRRYRIRRALGSVIDFDLPHSGGNRW